MENPSSGLVIDWRLLLLQAANFLLLWGILTWLLWKPLIRMVDGRRKLIAEGLAAAEAQKRAAAEASKEREKMLSSARQETAKMIGDVRGELRTERQAAKAELDKQRVQFAKMLDKELADSRSMLETELRAKTADLVVAAVGKVLQSGYSADDLPNQVAKVLKGAK